MIDKCAQHTKIVSIWCPVYFCIIPLQNIACITPPTNLKMKAYLSSRMLSRSRIFSESSQVYSKGKASGLCTMSRCSGSVNARPDLEKLKSKANRRLLAHYQTGCHGLRQKKLESGAHGSNVCPVCRSREVESVFHFGSECTACAKICAVKT